MYKLGFQEMRKRRNHIYTHQSKPTSTKPANNMTHLLMIEIERGEEKKKKKKCVIDYTAT